MNKIIVISDDHGDWTNTLKILQKEEYDVSVHLGDSLVSEETIKNNFTYYVSGNNDSFYKNEDTFQIDGIKFAIAHGHTIGVSMFSSDKGAYKFAQSTNASVVLHGHTHIAKDANFQGIRIINPGSTKHPRDSNGPSYAIIEIQNQQITKVRFILLHMNKTNEL